MHFQAGIQTELKQIAIGAAVKGVQTGGLDSAVCQHQPHQEKSKRWYEFLTSLFAILGGPRPQSWPLKGVGCISASPFSFLGKTYREVAQRCGAKRLSHVGSGTHEQRILQDGSPTCRPQQVGSKDVLSFHQEYICAPSVRSNFRLCQVEVTW